MNKKTILIVIVVLTLVYIGYRVIVNAVNNTLDEANRRSIEVYVSSIRLAHTYYTYKSGISTDNIDDLDIKLTVDVNCEFNKIYSDGRIELKGCTVEKSKKKYSYINEQIVRE